MERSGTFAANFIHIGKRKPAIYSGHFLCL
nr:MAG TPA: hypothetical protein [Bacteriophage sp.]DAJ04303.1 MAG TPA: hypothetical protein [Bacteriophage sp.]